MPLIDVAFAGTFDGPEYVAAPTETIAGRLDRLGAVEPWSAGGAWMSGDTSGLRFTPHQQAEGQGLLAGGQGLLVEVLLRRDVAVDPPDQALLTIGDLIRYARVAGQWQLVAGGSVLPAPNPTSAFLQHLAVLVTPIRPDRASATIWFNGWQLAGSVELDWRPESAPEVVLGQAGGVPASHLFVAGFAVSPVDAVGGSPPFVIADIPANAVPVNPDDDEETLVRKASNVRPTPVQRRWQELGLTAFVHFGMATFAGVEGGDGFEDPKLFDPSALDCRQWARGLKEAGFTMAILTTKHADGFLLWPTRYSGHSVAASPWRDGHGDVVKEFVEAMRAEGLRVGLYFSPLSRHEMRVRPSGVDPRHHRFGGSEDKGEHWERIPGPERDVPETQRFRYLVDEYNAVYLRQLHELLTEYGEIDEVWLDGNADWYPDDEVRQRFAGRLWYDMARKLQPEVKFFNGWEIRWVGNEDGLARDAEWSVLPVTGDLDGNMPYWTTPEAEAPVLGDRRQWPGATYLVWHPAEVDVSIRPGWFYHPQEQPKSVEELLAIYVRSVGRNTNLLLNVPADTRGLLPDEDLAVLTEFAELRAQLFGADVISGLPTDGWSPDDTASVLELPLTASTPVRYIEVAEDLGAGQRVERFSLSVLSDGEWVPFGSGSTIGHRRIVDAGRAIPAEAVRFEIESARGTPAITQLRAYADRT